ncbi:MAG: DUF4281 domain-containing protein [Bacteroidetes bacterium]|nr:MAG: DUF4281 domain-containing protein [Bacteroidota bacterium]
MTPAPELLFSLLSYSPGPFWLLILFLPTNRKAMLAVDGYLLLLSLLFVIQTLPALGHIIGIIFQPEFEEMRAFIGSEAGFLGAWNHMILGDLWIGRWVAHDSLRFERAWLIRLLFIPVILVVGPFGLCFYLIFRMIATRSFGFHTLSDAAKAP